MKLLDNSSYFDLLRRKKFAKIELDYLMNKAIISNVNIPLKFRYFFFLNKIRKFTRIKNHCRISGKSKTVFKDIGLARMPFKHYATFGRLSGIRLINR